jgi:hypothetical protein
MSPPPGPLLYCSFCRKDQHHVSKLVAGPSVHICDACIALSYRAARGKRIPRFPGWESLTNEQLLATLPAAAAAVDAAQQTLRDHVALLRERDMSWERIGEALGISRQAAWERFSKDVG